MDIILTIFNVQNVQLIVKHVIQHSNALNVKVGGLVIHALRNVPEHVAIVAINMDLAPREIIMVTELMHTDVKVAGLDNDVFAMFQWKTVDFVPVIMTSPVQNVTQDGMALYAKTDVPILATQI